LKELEEVFRDDPTQVQTLQPRPSWVPGGTGTRPVMIELLIDDPDHERLPDTDAEIVERCVGLQSSAGREVTVVSYDTGLRLRARGRGIAPLVLPD
jgi:predicted ribonuclease YlaK